MDTARRVVVVALAACIPLALGVGTANAATTVTKTSSSIRIDVHGDITGLGNVRIAPAERYEIVIDFGG